MTALDSVRMQKRTIATLMMTQSLGTAGQVTVLAALGLLAADLTGHDTLAGLPAAIMTLGAAILAGPLARRATRRGRRPALWMGYGLGAVGAIIGGIAGQLGSFPLLLAGMLIFGGALAAGLQTRFAAADLSEPEHRARSMGLVVWVGALGGLIGPALSPAEIRIGELVGLREWVAPLLIASVFFAGAGLTVAVRLRPDPLPPRPDRSRSAGSAASGHHRFGQTWSEIAGRPLAILAIGTVAMSQAAMVAVMTMTPLHMRDHGQAGLAAWVIGLHVLGMFGLAPLVGRLVDRVGPVQSIRIGAVVLGSGVVASVAAGYQPVLIFIGLFLLGVGWSFGLIAGSTLLTGAVPDAVRVPVQGFSDAILSLLAAIAAFGSGLIKESLGFHWLANMAVVMALMLIAAATLLKRRQLEPVPI